MTALHDFIQAAASHYGVPVDQLNEGSTLDASSGDLEVVLRIALTPEDMARIAQRMQRMALEREADAAQAAEAEKRAAEAAPGVDRAAYDALPPGVRSMYGSFGRFRVLGGVLPAPVPKVELPPHVWLLPSEATQQQKAMAVGADERGRIAVDHADLTEQQRTRLAGTVLDVVTSNADDFGGLPG